MRICYVGKEKYMGCDGSTHYYNYGSGALRVAEIIYNEDDAYEERLAEKLCSRIEAETGRHFDVFNGDIYVKVEDRDDYADFVEWYKTAKRTIKQELKIKNGLVAE